MEDQGTPYLTGGPRKLAQDEHSLSIRSGGDELLGDEVHSIMKRGHQTQIGGLIKRRDLRMGVVFLQEHNRLPRSRLESPVDPIHLRVQLCPQVMVSLNQRSARGSQLHKCKP